SRNPGERLARLALVPPMLELLRRGLLFAGRVLRRFYKGQGLLLASAVAYNALLSLVPLVGLIVTVVSAFLPADELLRLIQTEINIILPGSGDVLGEVFLTFASQRALAGGVSFVVLLVFSSIAFRALDEALGAMFVAPEHHRRKRRRFAGIVIPLIYIGLFATGLMIATLISIGLEMIPEQGITILGYRLSVAISSLTVFETLTFVALVALLASFYRVMPQVHVRMRYCLIGGFVAAVLWDVIRRTLVWYFTSVSLVGLIYGSLATVIVLLLSLEAYALVVLIGGQIIAEVDRSHRAGMAWYEEPRPSFFYAVPPSGRVSKRTAPRAEEVSPPSGEADGVASSGRHSIVLEATMDDGPDRPPPRRDRPEDSVSP
ncbi:MAG: YihY/virulence factor BrkB family protein, partial [Myxococcota bacterium]